MAIDPNSMYLVDSSTCEEVPLKSIFFEGNIFASRLVKVSMKQTYINESKEQPIEAVYFFPVEIGFTMSKVQVELSSLDDPNAELRVIETYMEEMKKAEQKYDDDIASGISMPVITK